MNRLSGEARRLRRIEADAAIKKCLLKQYEREARLLEAALLYQSFGTQRAVAEVLGISVQRVSQLLAQVGQLFSKPRYQKCGQILKEFL